MNKTNDNGVAKTSRSISSGWTFRELPRLNVPAHLVLAELPAQVPGYVHLDLMRNGVIDDPFRDLNEKSVAWIDETDWEYRTTFQVDEKKPGATFLLFEGLDTVAEIVLNGEVLASVDNMHRAYEFDVTEKLRCGEDAKGDNELVVTFRSAPRVGRERHDAWDAAGNATMPQHYDIWGAKPFIRKAQYMFGWDWGPVMPSCGIFKAVQLVNIPVARITSWAHDVKFTADGKAIVTVEVDIERTDRGSTDPLSLNVGFELKQRGITPASLAETFSLAVQVGSTHFVKRIEVDEPELWWPNGLNGGKSKLYRLALELTCRGKKVDSLRKRVGLRTIELLQEPDSDGAGESFRFCVNGSDIFVKGANWIPAGSFPGHMPVPEPFSDSMQYRNIVEHTITKAAQAGMNMLRVWGGGMYESETFYDLCDHLGILVWQDFPFGCAYYPDDNAFCEAVRIEASENVRRIRHHASLALWCGNNENQMMHFDAWAGTRPPRLLGGRLYDDILPAVIAAEDPRTAYWPGSPYGSGAEGENPNGPDFGDRHNWDVWHGIGDWKHYTADKSRFVSEFGFASSCGMAAWEKYISPNQRTPYSPAVRWHEKTRKGYDTYLGLVEIHFPKPQSLEDLVYYTQLNQAEALKYGVEHYRRLKGRCWGTLFWQINDCWPVQSWSVIDYLGEPKAAYWAMRKFYAPVLVSLVKDGNSVAVHMVSDKIDPVYGTLTITLQHFDGSVISRIESEVELGANTSTLVETFNIADASGMERETVVRAVFVAGDGTCSENTLLLAEPKDLRIANPGITWRIESEDHFGANIQISAERFAPYVWVRVKNESLSPFGQSSDNFFHLFPGETKALRINGRTHEFENNLTIRWLW